MVVLTTLNTPLIVAPQAELRALSSANSATSAGPVLGTEVEEAPVQSLGGGWNSSMRVQEVEVTPLQPGASINVQWVLGVQQSGYFRFFVNIEPVSNLP